MTDARRINRGSGHSYEIAGQKIPGVTTILGDEGFPKPALVNWAANITADYALNHWEELTAQPPADRLQSLRAARHTERKAAAARGTQIHAYAEQLLTGEEIEIPDTYRDPVDQCLAFLAAWDIREIAAEVTVINRASRYMGTADLLARCGESPDVWLFDYKTGKGPFSDTALQLAAYANCETMLVPGPDGEPFEIALPRIDHAAAVLIRSDHYEVVPVDIVGPNPQVSTFRYFQYVQQVYEFVTSPRSDYIGEPLPAPSFEPTP